MGEKKDIIVEQSVCAYLGWMACSRGRQQFGTGSRRLLEYTAQAKTDQTQEPNHHHDEKKAVICIVHAGNAYVENELGATRRFFDHQGKTRNTTSNIIQKPVVDCSDGSVSERCRVVPAQYFVMQGFSAPQSRLQQECKLRRTMNTRRPRRGQIGMIQSKREVPARTQQDPSVIVT